MKKVIFSDIDGTLIHKLSKERAFNREVDDLIQVSDENRFVSKKTVDLISKLRENEAIFILITGRRKSGYQKLAQVIPHDYAVIEHGCVILENGDYDQGWLKKLEPVIGKIGSKTKEGVLWRYEQFFRRSGYNTDSNGRLATFRVYHNAESQNDLSEEEKVKIESLKHPHGITTTRNMDMLDILPALGGKLNAMNYLIEKYAVDLQHIIGLGDDVNDHLMLKHVALPMTHNGANKEIKELVNLRKGYVSTFDSYKATEDMLSKILKELYKC